ncbi:PEP-CTERM sorting domain-containing protein [Massilia sp. W12]|uniref:PEP-CTERM sorting domain-containing protein n=1 Tax=Massilia sp. W12 TaxID=3126507 RepID=UPI0030D32A1C
MPAAAIQAVIQNCAAEVFQPIIFREYTMKKIQTIAALSALVLAGAAQAASFNNTAGLAGITSYTLETFDNAGVPDDTLAGNLFAGLSFGPNIYISNSYIGSFANFSGSSLTNFYPCCTAITSFSFNSQVKAAAFAFVTNQGTSTFYAKLNGNVVESFSAPTNTQGNVNFYGFSGIIFDSIEIHSGGINNAYALDNLQVAAVPEAETWGMMLAGLGALGFMARRRQSQK